MDLLRGLTFEEIVDHFDDATVERALELLDGRSVTDLSVTRDTADTLSFNAFVIGSTGGGYRAFVQLQRYAGYVALNTTCTCPVRYQCKHGLALSLAAAGTGSPGRSLEQRLGDLLHDLAALAPPDVEPRPLALQVTWHRPGPGSSSSPPGAPRLHLRPLRPGRTRGWAKSGAGWNDLPGAAMRGEFLPAHLEVLRALASALERHSRRWWSAEPSVADFGPDVVPLLLEARSAGVELVLRGLATLHLADKPVAPSVDVTAGADGGARLVTGLDHDGRHWHGEAVLLAGDPAHTAVLREGDDVLTLARLERRLARGPSRALQSPPLELAADELGTLAPTLTRLRRLVPVTSRDGSVEVPAPPRPRLVLTVRWQGAGAATVAWQWRYGRAELDLDAVDDPDGVRDRAAEREVLARLPHTSTAPAAGRREVTGADALHLAVLELPTWRACDDVEVVEVDAPEFRETEATPEIAFGTREPTADGAAPPADEGETDWLDLWVTITVDGEHVPLAAVVAALTLDDEYVILPSGLFFRTDRPEFARLASVVRAAGELREPDGDRVTVGKHDLGLWAQLAEVGVVDAQAEEWVRRARALRDLTELPRPEPTGVVSTLRPYQLDGFHWLAFLWQHRLGGVLADDMGLGKTLQVLALVAHTRAETDAPFLVVAPTSVVSAWAAEAERHTPGLRVATVTATARRRERSIAEIAAGADVVVTSYTLHRLETDAYAGVTWAGLVLDEAQQVKNHQSRAYSAVRRTEAPFRLVVTGTPFENRLMEYWSLLSIAAPGVYPRPRSFVENVVRPVEKEGDDAALRRFTARIRPFVLRRTKELVAADLPPKQEQVLAVELSPRHRRLYDTHLNRERQRILGLLDDFDGNRIAVLAALTRLRQLALDPALVDEEHERVGSAKLDVLVDHLTAVTAEGHRALVFSTFTGYLRRARARLEAAGVATAYLDGSTTDRDQVIASFRAGEAPVFLISLKAGGVGLTLTEADYVFVLDPWWNPAAEAQAVDRAHRIGQTETVMVYRLVSSDTIEDKVMALKARKAELFRKVVDGDGAAAQAISAADIRALFD
ncbi:DEAD/DEAH box helicase [Nocardioides marinquilinus]|uniref:DEAD/DEAH box helicase n=1 Tax=Nocardioides marinquilinus TaxID=1210400 RepID=A0ABP9PNZ0_9ACTN